MRPEFIVFIVMILAISCSASARTWYILPDSTGDAPTIQAGVDSAGAGDTVLVACGIYHDCTHWLLEVEHWHCVIMKSGICLRSETGEPDCVTIDAQQKPSSRVIYCGGVDETASIEGFTITGGCTGDADSYPFGAGVYCENSSPSIVSCFFSENDAEYGCGGAVNWEGGSAVITDCTFSGNVAGCGGAVLYWGPSVTITDCLFSGNESLAGYGGAIVCGEGSVTIANCVFTSNTAYYDGGGLSFSGCTPAVSNCVFYGNVARSGGGVHFWGCSGTITNCTFFGNSSGTGSGVHCAEFSAAELENTIIAFGRSGKSVGCDEGSNATLTCCDVYGNAEGDWVGCIADQYGINGNFSACPSFCNGDDGGFQLCDESPCLPGNHPDGYDCGLIGAWGEGCSCGPTPAVPTTWGAIKSMYK